MQWFYRIAYRLGFTPWEGASTHEAAMISEMFAREESEKQSPYGRALDLGCGSGMQSVQLARRGWQVTGVELVPKALDTARRRARDAGVDVQLVRGDVTDLQALGIGSDFQFVLDFGLFHGLDDVQRQAMGREVTKAAAPGATLLMIAWGPGSRWPLPRGASANDIERAFPAWKVIGEDAISASALPAALKNVNPRFYRLRHRPNR